MGIIFRPSIFAVEDLQVFLDFRAIGGVNPPAIVFLPLNLLLCIVEQKNVPKP
jgi:hypothetical protein